MHRSVINSAARRCSSGLIRAGARPLSERDLAQPALVFAPHADDETLGCGGTIMRKLAAGATVGCVFVTDSGKSHRGMPGEELAAHRRCEAVEACAVLGVDRQRIRFLNFPDGSLKEHVPELAQRVSELLREFDVTQVLAPYRHDNHEDHLATNHAVQAGILAGERSIIMLEYPVWFWEHWPWMEIPLWWKHRARRSFKRAVLSPMHALCDLRRWVDVADVLEVKKRALHAHATQMSKLKPDWTTLAEVSNGDFLERMLQDREWFARRVIRPRRRRSAGA